VLCTNSCIAHYLIDPESDFLSFLFADFIGMFYAGTMLQTRIGQEVTHGNKEHKASYP